MMERASNFCFDVSFLNWELEYDSEITLWRLWGQSMDSYYEICGDDNCWSANSAENEFSMQR